MTRRVLKTSCGLHLVSQSEAALIDSNGTVILQELAALARSALDLKRAGHRVVVTLEESAGGGADFLGNQGCRNGYAAMVVSQTKLMAEWKKCFDSCNQLSGQVLVDASVFHDNHSSQQLAGVLTELVAMSVIPLVGLSASGRGAGNSKLDTFLVGLLDNQANDLLAKVAV